MKAEMRTSNYRLARSVLFAQLYWEWYIEETEMYEACNTHEEKTKF